VSLPVPRPSPDPPPSFSRRQFFFSPPPSSRAAARDFPRKSRENYVTSDGFGRNWDKVQCTLALRFTTRCFYAVIFPGLGNTHTVAPCSLGYSQVIFAITLSLANRESFSLTAPDRETRVSPPERELTGKRGIERGAGCERGNPVREIRETRYCSRTVKTTSRTRFVNNRVRSPKAFSYLCPRIAKARLCTRGRVCDDDKRVVTLCRA